MTRLLLSVLAPLEWLNRRLMPAGSVLAAILLALMVIPTMLYSHYQARAEGTK